MLLSVLAVAEEDGLPDEEGKGPPWYLSESELTSSLLCVSEGVLRGKLWDFRTVLPKETPD